MHLGLSIGAAQRRRLLFCSGVFLLLAAWSWPLWWAYRRWGIYDWNTTLQRIEAIRATVVVFHQWPGNNPWMTGGCPLLGNPALSLFSPPGFLSLALGSSWGVHLSVLFFICFGFWGAWRLSSLWWPEPWVRLTFSLYVVANPAITYHLAVGHIAFSNYYCFPLALYFTLGYARDRWAGAKAGIVVSFAFLHSAAYVVQYTGLILAVVLLWVAFTYGRKTLPDLIRWCVLFVTTCAALCSYRVLTILPVASAFPRTLGVKFHLAVITVIKALYVPIIQLGRIAPPEEAFCGTSHEVCCYLGVIASVLALISAVRQLRWWHIATVCLVWASAGNDSPLYIMYWLQKLPTFGSHLCFGRIRIFISLFLGISAASCLHKFSTRSGPKLKPVFVLIGMIMCLEVAFVSRRIMELSHVPLPFTDSANYNSTFSQWGRYPSPTSLKGPISWTYFSTRQNQGFLRGEGDSYINDNPMAVGRDEPGYISEFYQGEKPVAASKWSPNYILFERLNPGTSLRLNMNPGKAWWINGNAADEGQKIVSPTRPFLVAVQDSGRIELSYHSPGHTEGISMTLVFLGILGATVYWYRRADLTSTRLALHPTGNGSDAIN